MKNAMKKIMSLVLVAMILVSALPFAASADTAEMTFYLEVKVDGVKQGYKTVTVPVGTLMNEATIKSYAQSVHADYFSNYTYEGVYDADRTAEEGVYFGAGLNFKTKPVETPPAAPEMIDFWIELKVDGKHIDSKVVSVLKGTVMDEAAIKQYAKQYLYGSYFGNGYTYTGCYDFGGKAGENGYIGAGIMFETKSTQTTPSTPSTPSTPDNTDKVVGEEWMKGIWLYIYTNKNIITPAKYVQLDNNLIVKDHVLSQAEIMSVVDDYYKATNANNGIIWKGAYMENANIDAINFVDGRNEVPFEDLDVARSAHTVIIKVRVDGVTAITSTNSNADSTNPKTGDTIMVPFTIMTVSASLLAVAYFVNKKRAF